MPLYVSESTTSRAAEGTHADAHLAQQQIGVRANLLKNARSAWARWPYVQVCDLVLSETARVSVLFDGLMRSLP